jgi:hypothetical protein
VRFMYQLLVSALFVGEVRFEFSGLFVSDSSFRSVGDFIWDMLLNHLTSSVLVVTYSFPSS